MRYGYHNLVGASDRQARSWTPSCKDFQFALRTMQGMANLLPDGDAGPITRGEMSLSRCGVPDFAAGAEASADRWPIECSGGLRSFCDFTGLSSDELARRDLEQLWYDANRETMRVCDVSIERTPSIGAGHFHATAGQMSEDVLAWAEFPIACSIASDSEFGTRWNWTRVLMQDTALHEQGHQMGLPHGPAGSVMFWRMDRAHNGTWKDWDVRQLVARYGQPADEPEPEPDEPEPEGNLWEEILEQLLELAGDCLNVRSSEATHERASDPKLREHLAVRAAVRRAMGSRWSRDGRDVYRDVVRQWRESSPQELATLIDEATK